MNRYISRLVKKQLQRRGIYLKRYRSVQYICDSLKVEDPKIQIYELKNICKTLQVINNHTFYEELLKAFVPDWRENTKDAIFIVNETRGRENLNTYRKIKNNDQLLFEKVYYTNSLSLKKLQWFENYLRPLIKDTITVPRIVKSVKGDLLTILYFEYIDMANKPENPEERGIEISKILYDLSVNNPKLQESVPSGFSDFKKHPHYKKKGKAAQSVFKDKNIDFERIERILRAGTHIFTHGDMFKDTNMFGENGLIDWDELGLYPLGFEQGFIFYGNILMVGKAKVQPLIWLKNNYHGMVDTKDWNLFELSFLYFLYIFSLNIFKKREFDNFRISLLRDLKVCANLPQYF